MRLLRPASEDDMVAVFLAAEVTSERYGPQITEIHARLGQPRSVVEWPDTSDQAANTVRRQVLAGYCGYPHFTSACAPRIRQPVTDRLWGFSRVPGRLARVFQARGGGSWPAPLQQRAVHRHTRAVHRHTRAGPLNEGRVPGVVGGLVELAFPQGQCAVEPGVAAVAGGEVEGRGDPPDRVALTAADAVAAAFEPDAGAVAGDDPGHRCHRTWCCRAVRTGSIRACRSASARGPRRRRCRCGSRRPRWSAAASRAGSRVLRRREVLACEIVLSGLGPVTGPPRVGGPIWLLR